MKKVAILIHGFNTYDGGTATTSRLSSYLPNNTNVDYLKYNELGRRLITEYITIKYSNAKQKTILINKIKEYTQKGYEVTLIGHSNGAALIYLATNEITDPEHQVRQVMLINAALDSSVRFQPNIRRINVLYSPYDKATRIAKFMSSILPSFLEYGRPWGDMGAVGATAKDDRVHNYDINHIYTSLTDKKKEFGHSDIFRPENLEVLGPWIERILES